MSDNEEQHPVPADESTEESSNGSADDLSPAEEASGGATKVEKEPRRRNAIVGFAVLLSLLALLGVGYTLFEIKFGEDDDGALETEASLDDLRRRLDQSGDAIAELQSQIEALRDSVVEGVDNDIEDVRSEVDEKIGLLSSLPPRMSAVENSVASLAGISSGARETFLLAEAEYYMQIANAQLQLANNPQLASLALGMADERVTQLSNPGLTDVRRALSDELAALDVMEKPDLEGATLTLASLASVVESLPLASSKSRDNNADNAPDPDASGFDRAWQSTKDAMSGLVKVTPPDQAKLAMLSPDAEFFLRNNIAMQLQAARLALLRGEQSIFEQALDDSSVLLNTYFDSSSEQVSGALQTITEIRERVYATSAPDISTSLRLLRQFRTLSESAE